MSVYKRMVCLLMLIITVFEDILNDLKFNFYFNDFWRILLINGIVAFAS